ncbi:MAG: acyl-CoA dehydrogenase family protein [Alphaproteobacteria bacterium]|nr:acyl-CoA dehydrogenase family protein [Alphaproteobacteria bacterium]MBL7099493.1 acyl-CoA dehydrogenase family protein [Alphaproteobacteria bacterium]
MLSITVPHLLAKCDEAVLTAEGFLIAAKNAVADKVMADGKISSKALDREQRATHGLAWLATYVEALRQMARWGRHLEHEKKLGGIEQTLLLAAFAEYLPQIVGGIPMSQNEIARPYDFGLDDTDTGAFWTDAVRELTTLGQRPEVREAIADYMAKHQGAMFIGEPGLDDTMSMIREQFFRFAQEKVTPFAHQWHLKDELIPIEVVNELSALGVFGLTVPENYGGAGLSKTAMCVVSEELSRGHIGVGSLATRSEIAAELILNGGTKEQKEHWLPLIASGAKLPTAVFTEPAGGSDVAALKTRGAKDGDVYKITGNKTWITHAARADVMTLLVRTNSAPGYRGLSMFLAEKPRGTESEIFPAKGMSGGEIRVLGYRGMKEYEIGFDGFEVPAANLLGLEEGQGFKQLMQTFESARIQTAARAVGVALCAMDLGLRYAVERTQFGRPLIEFPRVRDKLAMMAVEITVTRQLSYYAAREKDEGRRCDLEAGMAKLLGARVAWSCADNALQIHGGNGFALEYPISRVLCDARILNIFEGAAEIQSNVIARRLLEDRAN